jgi:hypothetical protein
MDTLFRESDFLCVNCPLSEETRHLVGAQQFSLMKPTAFFVNTARGPIVGEKALRGCIVVAPHRGRSIDVFEVEPTPPDPLLKLDSIIVTPHHICLTERINTAAASVFNACRDRARRVPRNVVNQQVLGRVYFHPSLDNSEDAPGEQVRLIRGSTDASWATWRRATPGMATDFRPFAHAALPIEDLSRARAATGRNLARQHPELMNQIQRSKAR